MKNVQKVLAGVVFGVAGMSAAQAEWSANIGVASAYIFRGLNFSDNAAVSGGIDWSSDVSGLYAGSWVSSVSGADELDLYGGYAFDLGGGLGLDLGAIVYLFPSSDENTQTARNSSLNATEIYAGLGGGAFSGTVWYGFGAVNDTDDDEYVYIEANAEFPLHGQFSLGLHVGTFVGLGDAFDGTSTFGGELEDSYVDYGVSIMAGDFALSVTATDIDTRAATDLGITQGASERPEVVLSWSKSWEGLGQAK